MNFPFRRTATLLAALLLLDSASAETVFRCGNAYADVPCPAARVIDVDDARTPGQQAAARDVAAREKALAAQMAADRQLADARPRRSAVPTQRKRPASTAPVPTARAPRRGARRLQDNGQGDFVAFAPALKRPAAASK